MFPYTNRARVQDSKQQNFELARGCTYDLQSVVVHVGNLESGQFNFQVWHRKHTDNTGHYVSYSRVGNQWLKFNDHTVTLASKSQVLNEQAFLLFYVIQSLAWYQLRKQRVHIPHYSFIYTKVKCSFRNGITYILRFRVIGIAGGTGPK